MVDTNNLSSIRREYGTSGLNEEDVHSSPMVQFERWLTEALQQTIDEPTHMVLSTVDKQGHPDSRVVLLKGLEDGVFVFYTNYQSAKAAHIDLTPYVALNFYWPSMARQVRVRGHVEQVSAAQSDAYFSSRPKASQLSALASSQSKEIMHRAELEQALNELCEKYKHEPIVRPRYWGGYKVIPDEFEFFQGRDNRLHDRIHYYLEKSKWLYRRLSP